MICYIEVLRAIPEDVKKFTKTLFTKIVYVLHVKNFKILLYTRILMKMS